jgi:hypothetical protein
LLPNQEELDRIYKDWEDRQPVETNAIMPTANTVSPIILANENMKIAIKMNQSFFITIRTPQTQVVVRFDVREALACRSFGDKLKFVEHLCKTY